MLKIVSFVQLWMGDEKSSWHDSTAFDGDISEGEEEEEE